jgi:hypothetical protein
MVITANSAVRPKAATLAMTVLLPPVFFMIFIALALAVLLEASRG